MSWFKLLPLLLILGLAQMALADETVVSDPDQREILELTVYNSDLALIREVREVTLPEGTFSLEFQGVPERIRPATLLVEAGGRTGLTVYEQNYEFDLMSREKILEKYVGREIAWIQEDGERITGRLLGMAAGPVYEVDGEVVFTVPGRVALPQLPENLRARPTLVWKAKADRSGEADLDVNYLTGGLSWNADYVLQLDEKGRMADLKGWVTVENRSGTGYEQATLQLVAGEINQVRPAMMRHMNAPMAMESKMYDGGGVEEETLYDYHLYTVPWATDLPNNSNKQVSLLESQEVPVERRYSVRGHRGYFRGGPPQDKQDVAVSYIFQNDKESNLGMPLPAGVVRVYGQSSKGRRQLLGEDRVKHTPKDEEIELHVGTAFDLVAERVRQDYRKVADRVHRTTWEITLRNHKDEDVVIDVYESVGGDWEILKSSLVHEKVSAEMIKFAVPVKKDGEAVLTYTVEVTY